MLFPNRALSFWETWAEVETLTLNINHPLRGNWFLPSSFVNLMNDIDNMWMFVGCQHKVINLIHHRVDRVAHGFAM